MSGLTKRVSSGAKKTVFASAASAMMQAVALIVLARLLNAVDYGQFALTTALAALTVGLANGVIERTLVIRGVAVLGVLAIKQITAVSAVIAVATFVTVAVAAWAGGFALRLDLLALQLAAGVVLGMAVAPRVVLRRRFAFGAVVFAELMGQSLGLVLATIVLASAGFGALALGLGVFIQSLVLTLILLMLTRHILFVTADPLSLGDSVETAIGLAGLGILEISFGRSPALVIGGLLGSVPLGLFNRAYSLVQMPLELLATAMSRVLVNAFMEAASDRHRLISGTRTLIRLASAILTPVACGLAATGDSLTSVVLGETWNDAAPLFPWLALLGWTTTIAHMFAILAEATSHISDKVRIQFRCTLLLVGGLAVGCWFGLQMAAAALAACSTILLMMYLELCRRILAVGLKTIIAWLMPGIIAGTITLAWCLLSWRYYT